MVAVWRPGSSCTGRSCNKKNARLPPHYPRVTTIRRESRGSRNLPVYMERASQLYSARVGEGSTIPDGAGRASVSIGCTPRGDCRSRAYTGAGATVEDGTRGEGASLYYKAGSLCYRAAFHALVLSYLPGIVRPYRDTIFLPGPVLTSADIFFLRQQRWYRGVLTPTLDIRHHQLGTPLELQHTHTRTLCTYLSEKSVPM